MAIEYTRYNSPTQAYCERIEVAMNFLNRIVLDEPYNPFPDEPTPIIFEAIEDGRLVAAAAVTAMEPTRDQFILKLMGVIPDRRSSGIGGELLRHVEQGAVQLGASALLTFAMNERAFHFYTKFGYVLADDPEYLVKRLLTSVESHQCH